MLGHGIATLLLTAIGGYWVLERASAHKGQLKQVGYLLGSIIIVVSLVGVGKQIWFLRECQVPGGMRGMMGKMGGYRPVMPQPGEEPGAEMGPRSSDRMPENRDLREERR